MRAGECEDRLCFKMTFILFIFNVQILSSSAAAIKFVQYILWQVKASYFVLNDRKVHTKMQNVNKWWNINPHACINRHKAQYGLCFSSQISRVKILWYFFVNTLWHFPFTVYRLAASARFSERRLIKTLHLPVCCCEDLTYFDSTF